MKKCKKCGGYFEPIKGLKNYCSISCRNSRNWTEEDKLKKSESNKKWFNDLSNEEKNERNEKYVNINGNIEKIEKTIKSWNYKIFNSEYSELSEYSLRKRIIIEQDYKCNNCGLDKWLGEQLTLELEHIDGDNKNNERNNLEAICPNCHSLTKTWRGKNGRKNTISDDEFLKKLLNSTNIHQALIDLNLSPKGNNYRRAKGILEKYYLENIKYE